MTVKANEAETFLLSLTASYSTRGRYTGQSSPIAKQKVYIYPNSIINDRQQAVQWQPCGIAGDKNIRKYDTFRVNAH